MWTLSQWPIWWNKKLFSPGVANSSVGETWFARSRDDSKGAAWPEIPHQHGSQLPKCTPDAFCAPCRQLLSLGVWILFYFYTAGEGCSIEAWFLPQCLPFPPSGGRVVIPGKRDLQSRALAAGWRCCFRRLLGGFEGLWSRSSPLLSALKCH